ncbi:DUF4240 domain-containing protein [Dactylosporangium sp. NPDC000521]|uniref:DUF4240 domain-containing protein n=1 Tax=Dactylosporangium sp. NPDC000521 TaxID=3363975 RepID=UPI00369B84B4
MNTDDAWRLVDQARADLPEPVDAHDVAARMAALLTAREPADILAVAQPLWDLFTQSYRADLWAAAYLINDGASDDGFDYFRGWLIAQGQTTYEQAVASPDSLAGHPAVIQAATGDGVDTWCEEMISIAWSAYETVTGEPLPGDALTGSYPDLDPDWDFDFDDDAEMRRRLPRLAALYLNDDA